MSLKRTAVFKEQSLKRAIIASRWNRRVLRAGGGSWKSSRFSLFVSSLLINPELRGIMWLGSFSAPLWALLPCRSVRHLQLNKTKSTLYCQDANTSQRARTGRSEVPAQGPPARPGRQWPSQPEAWSPLHLLPSRPRSSGTCYLLSWAPGGALAMVCPSDLGLLPACLIGFLFQFQFCMALISSLGLKPCSETWMIRMGPDQPLAPPAGPTLQSLYSPWDDIHSRHSMSPTGCSFCFIMRLLGPWKSLR